MATYIFSGFTKSGPCAHFFFGAIARKTNMRPVDIHKVSETVQPVVEGQGYELVDVEWKHEAGRWVLRIFIDRREGATDPNVSLDDCAGVSHEVSAVLDVSDTIAPAYSLEVSSPGLNRPLKKEAD